MRRICCFATALFLVPLPFLTAGDDFKLEPGYVLLFNGKNLDGWKEVVKELNVNDDKVPKDFTLAPGETAKITFPKQKLVEAKVEPAKNEDVGAVGVAIKDSAVLVVAAKEAKEREWKLMVKVAGQEKPREWAFKIKDRSLSLAGKTDAYKGRFKVADGVLIYNPKVGGDRYIETTKEFDKDVHFKFDFKPGPGCNNDILFRGTKFDIVPGKKENESVEMGKWSTFELVAKGDVIEHKINGKTVRTTKGKAKASPFKLRAEFGEIEIKNIRCKEG